MFTGGASSDAWLVRCRPGSPASAKHSANCSGGSGASAASMPRPISSSRRFAMTSSVICIAIGDRVLAVHVGDQAAPHAEVGLGGARSRRSGRR